MKKALFVLIAIAAFAQELHIKSKTFVYDSKKLESIFTGDVNATRGKDNILADKMVIFFNKQKKPVKFEAIGHVRFVFVLDNNTTYKGHCEKLEYFIKSGDIILIGNAYVKKLQTNESISADKIKINRFTKDVNVVGEKKPVNIIIKVD
jgi:lipopolysaccharide export system protein LptA